MSTSTYIIIGAAALVVLGGFLFFQSKTTPEVTAPPSGDGGEQGSLSTVTYTDSGYSPREATISQGGTVTFKNQSSREMWPATAIHPTHTIYPGSDIQKCGTSEDSRIFDACKGVAPGESWSFRFREEGSWGYHDHLQTSNTGKIIVE